MNPQNNKSNNEKTFEISNSNFGSSVIRSQFTEHDNNNNPTPNHLSSIKIGNTNEELNQSTSHHLPIYSCLSPNSLSGQSNAVNLNSNQTAFDNSGLFQNRLDSQYPHESIDAFNQFNIGNFNCNSQHAFFNTPINKREDEKKKIQISQKDDSPNNSSKMDSINCLKTQLDQIMLCNKMYKGSLDTLNASVDLLSKEIKIRKQLNEINTNQSLLSKTIYYRNIEQQLNSHLLNQLRTPLSDQVCNNNNNDNNNNNCNSNQPIKQFVHKEDQL